MSANAGAPPTETMAAETVEPAAGSAAEGAARELPASAEAPPAEETAARTFEPAAENEKRGQSQRRGEQPGKPG